MPDYNRRLFLDESQQSSLLLKEKQIRFIHTRFLLFSSFFRKAVIAVFRISFRPIRELPIESNPNCRVNWLTAQKVKKAKYYQFSVI